MSIELDATPQGASANSYVTLGEANDYFAARTPSGDWDEASEEERKRALVSATVRIDQEDFDGHRTKSEQALRWPRAWIVDPDGWSIQSDEIPERVKRAQMEMAYALLSDSDLLAETGLDAFTAASVGPVSVTMDRAHRPGRLPEQVRRELAPWLRTTTTNFRVERA